MATIFPSDPTIDEVYEKWKWDGTVWKLIGTFDSGNALHLHSEDTTNVHGIPDTLAAFSLQTYSSSEPADPNIGDIWVESDIDVPTIDSSRFLRWRKTMVGGETSLSGNDDGSLALQYTPNYEQLYINGVLQVRGEDYLATTGNTITGITALSSGDTVEVFSAVALAVADVYTQTQSDARFVNKIGGVFNVVSTTKTDVFSMASTTFADVTGLSVTITPSSTTSKILVIANISTGNIGANHNTFSIVRNSTLIAQPPTDTYSGSIGVSLTSSTDFKSASLTHLDSPSSTSPQTYKIQMKTSNAAATAYVNRRGDLATVSAVSSITAIEVGA